MPSLKQKRINFFISSSQREELERIISPTNTSLSDFIRAALDEYISKIKKQKLEEKLKEAYLAKAKLNLKICEDFKHADGENV